MGRTKKTLEKKINALIVKNQHVPSANAFNHVYRLKRALHERLAELKKLDPNAADFSDKMMLQAEALATLHANLTLAKGDAAYIFKAPFHDALVKTYDQAIITTKAIARSVHKQFYFDEKVQTGKALIQSLSRLLKVNNAKSIDDITKALNTTIDEKLDGRLNKHFSAAVDSSLKQYYTTNLQGKSSDANFVQSVENFRQEIKQKKPSRLSAFFNTVAQGFGFRKESPNLTDYANLTALQAELANHTETRQLKNEFLGTIHLFQEGKMDRADLQERLETFKPSFKAQGMESEENFTDFIQQFKNVPKKLNAMKIKLATPQAGVQAVTVAQSAALVRVATAMPEARIAARP